MIFVGQYTCISVYDVLCNGMLSSYNKFFGVVLDGVYCYRSMLAIN